VSVGRGAGGAEPAGGAAPWLSLAFVTACLATIPYGAPVPGWALGALAALGAAAVLAARLDRARRWDLVRVWPVVVVLGATALSAAMSRAPEVSLERSASMALYSLLAIAVQACMWDARSARGVAIAACATAGAVSADVLWQRFTGISLFGRVPGEGSRLSGSQGNLNDLAVASLLVPIAMAAVTPGPRAWLWRMAISLLALPAWWLSASRQAVGAWALGLLPAIRGARRAAVAGGVAAAIVAAAVALTPTLRARVVQTWNEGLGIREDLIVLGFSLAREHPVTGIGPGLFGAYYKQAAMAGWTNKGRELQKIGMPWVHCLPLEVACEYGVVGVVAFGGVLVAAVRGGVRARGDGIAARLARGGAWALVILFTVGLVDFTFIKDWVRCVWWVGVGLGSVSISPEKRSGHVFGGILSIARFRWPSSGLCSPRSPGSVGLRRRG
jgi:hypothetical protein